MNLCLKKLLDKMANPEQRQEILHKIHHDPLLTKKACGELDVFVANASKELFSPTAEHQLYAKGIIYRAWADTSYGDGPLDEDMVLRYELVGMPYLKMYNWDENDHVRKHAADMLVRNTVPLFGHKLDGTLISRNVINGRVVLSTRGMLETLNEITEDDENPGKFFAWSYKIIDEKYPSLRDPGLYERFTLLFELVGPGNQIVTFYPEWDLVLTGAYDKDEHRYLSYADLKSMAKAWGYNYHSLYEPEGHDLVQRIASLNRMLRDTDAEGTVIQFEENGRVVGRIKAKTDTYRTLLRVAQNCNYATVAEMIEKHPEAFETWDAFEAHLMGLGSANFPEELMGAYEAFFREYMAHKDRCAQFERVVLGQADRIFHKVGIKDYTRGLTREQRRDFALEAQNFKYPAALFAFVDGKLDVDYIMKKILKEPADSQAAVGVKA